MAGFLCFALPERFLQNNTQLTPKPQAKFQVLRDAVLSNSRWTAKPIFLLKPGPFGCRRWRKFFGTPPATCVYQICTLGSDTSANRSTWSPRLHSEPIPHQPDLSAQTRCTWSTRVLGRLPGPAVTLHQLWDSYAAHGLGPALRDPCPPPRCSSWVSPLCYMSCLQDTVRYSRRARK